jgi:tetratricopeptide (TPR) repeat protein
VSRPRISARLAGLALAGLLAPATLDAAMAQSVTLRMGFSSLAQECADYAVRGDAGARAISVCNEAIETGRLNRSNMIATRMNRGHMHLQRKEGAAALQDFDAVITLDKQNAEARLDRGVAQMMLEQPGLAVASITQALLIGVREPHKAYYNRAAAREALGDLQGAYDDYSTALQIEPDWGPANAEMQRIAQRRQQWLSTALASNQR